MEHESFESTAIAAFLNDNFVSIKVDREERPDVDQVYMTFIQATTGHGGWPMSVWLTPELRPFTGLNEEVSAYVFNQPGAKEFLDRYAELLQLIATGYRREGKRYVTIAVGCTGGKHRSVAMAEQLAGRLSGRDVSVSHRDLGRE